MEQLMAEYALEPNFPKEVLLEADTQAERDPFQRGERRDLGELYIACIDPADARDHDDALSLESLPKGGHRLGVHIADVAQYVREGGLLDAEARHRGNSTYFQFDTLPMLPPRLSGDLCSLLQDEERPALSAFMDIDARGEIVKIEIFESRLKVSAQLSYEEADALLEKVGEEADRMRGLLNLATVLRNRRAEEGAIQFELPERIPILEDGEVMAFGHSTHLRSHVIVEECMLAANREVARFLISRQVETLHRIHEPPDPEEIIDLQTYLAKRGIKWQPASPVCSDDYRRLAKSVSDHPDREPLLFRMLRSMKRAAYSPIRLGHFGLAWKDYLHFTSPIRRYPDLLVHRQIKAVLRGKKPGANRNLEALGAQLSEIESRSMMAERESLRLEMVLWARRHVGEVFDAEVRGVFKGGLLVRLEPSGVESFLPASLLGNEWFEFEDDRGCLRGERSGKVYSAGNSLRLRITQANIFSRRINFLLEEDARRGEDGKESSGKES